MITHRPHSARSLLSVGRGLSSPAINSAHSSSLRESVTELNAIVDPNKPGGLTFTELSHVVSLCPNLRKIGISLFGVQPQGTVAEGTVDQSWVRLAPPVLDEILQELRVAANASRISELRLHDWSDGSGILVKLLGVWPHISSLKFAGKLPPIGDPAISAHTISAAPCALEALSLNCATGTESTVDFIKWLLAGSQRTLRCLEFLKEPSAKLLEDIFARSPFPLDSVSIPSCASPEIGQIIRNRLWPTVVPGFGEKDDVIEDKALTRVQGLKAVFVEDPSTPLKLLVSTVRSRTVQTFGFGVDRNTDLPSVAHAIKEQTGLKRLVVLVWNGGERNVGIGRLRIACAIKGIELEETRDVRQFRAQKAWGVVASPSSSHAALPG